MFKAALVCHIESVEPLLIITSLNFDELVHPDQFYLSILFSKSTNKNPEPALILMGMSKICCLLPERFVNNR